jgi:hypothetical protein
VSWPRRARQARNEWLVRPAVEDERNELAGRRRAGVRIEHCAPAWLEAEPGVTVFDRNLVRIGTDELLCHGELSIGSARAVLCVPRGQLSDRRLQSSKI